MKRSILLCVSTLALALGLSACGWTTYTFVPQNTDDVTDITPPDDAAGDAFDATDIVTPDASDATDAPADAGPIVHYGLISIQNFALGTAPTSTATRSTALFVEQPNPTGRIIVHEFTTGLCTTVTHNLTIFTSGMITGTNVGTITLTNGTSPFLLNFNPGTSMYTPMSVMPRAWQDTDTINISWPGNMAMGGDEPPGAFSTSFGTPPSFTPLNPDGGMYSLDTTHMLTVTWTSTTQPVLVWIEQVRSDALVDILCTTASGTTSTGLLVPVGAMMPLMTGMATIYFGAGHILFNGVLGPPGPLLIVGQTVNRIEQVSVL